MKNLWNALRMLLWLTCLTGLLYPLVVTAAAHVVWRHKARGSLVFLKHKVIGSKLIAQKFEDARYFWPRPSANDYDSLASGGSNLGPTSKVLKEMVETRQKHFAISDISSIPSDLLYASGSGLDPEISPKAARFQIDRIVKARALNASGKKTVEWLVDHYAKRAQAGFLGQPRVNVLMLNLALDEIKP